MKFSLVTTCLNEMRSLPRWRADVEAQTRFPDEIVIVDSVSKDGTTELLRDWARADARVKIRIERCGAARGRNLAIELASHERVVSTDMGVRLDSHWFEEIVRPFEDDPAVEIVAGSYCIDRQSVISPAARAEYYLEDGGTARLGPGFVPGNRSVAYTKKVWRDLGGLPEDLTLYADDSVFGRQMVEGGFKTAYAPKAMTYWARPRKLKAFWKEQYNYGRGDGEADIKTPAAFRWYKKGLIPAWLVPPLHMLRVMTGHPLAKIKAVGRALRKGDVLACLAMPVLLAGNGWHLARGYLLGSKHGDTHCQACRARLAGPRGQAPREAAGPGRAETAPAPEAASPDR